jgi:asparagine synthase (glutamine-hydrolysing)
MRDLLPQSITRRVKQPYRSPDSVSFLGDDEPGYVTELLSREHLHHRGYFDADAVMQLIAKCRSGRSIGFADNMALVGILSTMLLDEIFIRRRAVD